MRHVIEKIEPIEYKLVDQVPALPCNQMNEFHQRLMALKPGEILCVTYPEGTSKNRMRQLRVNHISHAQWILGKGAVTTAIRGTKIYIWPKPVMVELGPVIYRAVPADEIVPTPNGGKFQKKEIKK
ncbi:MAG: hypothetical protein VB108_01335 [Anaerolineaceae bacterium]|nr:hypothetical protein [Anaerolineaceae bacterium]